MDSNIIQEILERIVRIETKIDGYNNLREKLDNAIKTNDVQDEKITTLDKSISKIEDNQKWIWRTLSGAIIVIAFGIFFELVKRM